MPSSELLGWRRAEIPGMEPQPGMTRSETPRTEQAQLGPVSGPRGGSREAPSWEQPGWVKLDPI